MNSTSNFWSIYDALTKDVSSGERIRSLAAGLHWFAVRSESSLGLAMGPAEGQSTVSIAGQVAGMPMREVAELAKSWNWADASLGMATINAWHNAEERVAEWSGKAGLEAHNANIFDYLLPRMKGRKVAVIGHFYGMDELTKSCDLTILERKPGIGDTPDPACELVLPESEVVIITGTTMINKTLPRLLELSRNAYVALAGPTTTLWPGWFERGVNMIAGVIVDDPDRVFQLVQEGGGHSFFGKGARMTMFERP